jgi:hypothetical protein
MGIVVGLAGWRREGGSRWLNWLAAALALLFLSAPAGIMLLVLLAPLAWLAWASRPEEDGDRRRAGSLATPLVIFVTLLLLGATAGLLNPTGLAAVANLPANWLREISTSQGYGLLETLVQLVLTEPLLVVTGLAGLVLGWRRRDWFSQGLGAWLALGVVLTLLRAGRNPADVALLAMPLALLAGPALAALLETLRTADTKLEMGALTLAGLAILGSVAVWMANFTASWEGQMNAAFLVSALVAVLVLVAVLAAFAAVFGVRLALQVGAVLLLVALALLGLRATMALSHNSDGLRWGSYRHTTGATDGANLTAYLERLASQRGGDLRDLRVALEVLPGTQPSPMLVWYLRDADAFETGSLTDSAARDVTVSLATRPEPGGQALSGRSFRIAQTWTPAGLRGGPLWRWLLYGQFDTLREEQRAVVWVAS